MIEQVQPASQQRLPSRIPLYGVAILLAEYLALSLFYDALPKLASTGGGAWLGRLGALAPLAVVFATLASVLFGSHLLGIWRRLTHASGVPRWRAGWLLAHFTAYALFLAVTDRLFGTQVMAPDDVPWTWAWLALAAVLLGALALAVASARIWVAFLREASPALARSAAVALVAWGAGFLSLELWQGLGQITLYGVAFLLQWSVRDLVFDPITAEVGSQRFYVTVAPICSGYEGIGLTAVFLGAYLWTTRGSLRFPNALALVPIGVLAVLVGNILRIAALILVGLHVSPRVALGGFHSKAGWIFFCAVGLGIVAWSRSAPWFSRDSVESVESDNPVAPYVVPLLALIAAALVTGLFSTGLDRAYFLRVLAGAGALYAYRHRLRPSQSWQVTLEAAGVGALVFVLWLALAPADYQRADGAASPLVALSPFERSAWIFFKLVGSIVVIPIVEERAFRGYLLRRVVSHDFASVPWHRTSWIAVGVSSLAFGALHQQWVAGTVAGALFAVLQARRGSLGEAVFAHAVSNALIAVWALGFGRMDLWI